MLFSSLTFLLYFFPAVILIHRVLPQKLQNAFLLLSSLVFYAWGDARQIPLFVVLLVLNWAIGLGISKLHSKCYRSAMLVFGLLCDFGALVFYKYTGFLMEILGLHAGFGSDIILPLGISFFIFQAAGYLIDVYRDDTVPEKSLVSFGAFLFMFPQLIAGPIVRYSDMEKALHQHRRPDSNVLESGMVLFVVGLSAKVLLANALGEAYTALRAITTDTLCAWLSLCSYTLQIYFDFMGYSVMAVGLGKMLGFSFPQNFNNPYAASSVTEFWRRWHITLSGWFKDYVYIPLGGSRRGLKRSILNLLVVWSLTGLWHGADWNFLLWGLWYFVLLCVEKFLLRGRIACPAFLRRGVTLLCVMLGWVLFVSEGLSGCLDYLLQLFRLRIDFSAWFWAGEYLGILVLGIIACIPAIVNRVKTWCDRFAVFRCGAALAALLLCIAALAKSTYNPFLYFRF